MTLGEFLKNKKLPLKLDRADWDSERDIYVELHYLHENNYYGHYKNKIAACISIDAEGPWQIYVEKPKKPRLLCWRFKQQYKNCHEGLITYYPEGELPEDLTEIVERMPHFDNPKEESE